jgi:endonuclease/exonuclease/phosphatase (EEP) superfamily protein YafD
MVSTLRRSFGWTLVGLSLALHVFTVLCYTRQPDRLAAFTVMPIWLWGGLGLLLAITAFYFLRASLSLVVTGVWAVTILVGADEASGIGRIVKPAPLPGPAEPFRDQRVMRVMTVNCGHFVFGNPAEDIAEWKPDIVLLQQAFPHQVKQVADVVFPNGERQEYRSNAVLSRWPITRRTAPMLEKPHRNMQVTVTLPNGQPLEVVNVHLDTAATDLRLWKRAAWRTHRENRVLRRNELSLTLDILNQTSDFPMGPVIFGGDFNAPATDIVHHQLARDFDDAFSEAGSGWGNTFHRRFPILRIDHIYASRHLTPVRCRAVPSQHTDHRMVVADFLFPG